MKTSDAIDKLAPAIVKAQGAIKPAVKDSENPHFRSKYADLSAVWEAVRETLHANGLAVIQLPVHVEDERVHLTTRLVHSSGQWIEETASIPVAKRDAHGFGSGYTYLRRYALSALLGVVADEDDDGNAAAKKNGDLDTGKHTARQTATDAFDMLPEEDQNAAQRAAAILIAKHGKGENLAEWIATQEWDNEEKLAIWHCLADHSKVRAAIQKQEKERRDAMREADRALAEQA